MAIDELAVGKSMERNHQPLSQLNFELKTMNEDLAVAVVAAANKRRDVTMALKIKNFCYWFCCYRDDVVVCYFICQAWHYRLFIRVKEKFNLN